MLSYETALNRILTAHRRFHTRAMTALHPGVKGPERARALAREQRLGQQYTHNMSRRLQEGLHRIKLDPSLSDPERDERARVLLATEQRYLQMHLTESARRVAREAELHRLIESGASSGFWLMDPSVHRHTPDCVAMGNRLWPMDVLRRVNPATRHAGCRCRIISEADARRMGHAIVRGYMTSGVASSLLREGQVDAPVWWPARERIREMLMECTIRVPWFPGAEDQFPQLLEARKPFDATKHLRNPKGPHGGEFTKMLAARHEHLEKHGGYKQADIDAMPSWDAAVEHAQAAHFEGDRKTVNLIARSAKNWGAPKEHVAALEQLKNTPSPAAPEPAPVVRPSGAKRVNELAAPSAPEAARAVQTKVPVHPGPKVTGAGDPYQEPGAERITSVRGTLHRSLDADMNGYLDAVSAGNVDQMQSRYEDMRAKAKRQGKGAVMTPQARDQSVRTIDRVHAAAINPTGEALPYGTEVTIGGRKIKVPLAPQEPAVATKDTYEPKRDPKTGRRVLKSKGVPWKPGLNAPWSTNGTFQWLVPDNALGSDTDHKLSALAPQFKVTPTPEGTILESRKGKNDDAEQLAHWYSDTLETAYPQLRRLRIKEQGQALADDRVLELRPDMAPKTDDDSRYPGLTTQALGDAAQAALPDFAKRLAKLGIQADPEDYQEFTLANPNRTGPLDWQSGPLGMEVKGEGWIGRAPGITGQAGFKNSPHHITPKSQREKLQECVDYGKEHGVPPLQPALLVPVVDGPNGVTHMMLLRYQGHWEGDKWIADPGAYGAFTGQRIPADMWEKLGRGELTPGEQHSTSPWTYVGTLPLRYNPHILPTRQLANQICMNLRQRDDPKTQRVDERQAQAIIAGRRTDPQTGVEGPRGSQFPARHYFTDEPLQGDIEPKDATSRRMAPKRPPTARKISADEQRAKVVALVKELASNTGRPPTNKEVGDRLGMNHRTVSKHLKQHLDLTGEDLRPGAGARNDRHAALGFGAEQVSTGSRRGGAEPSLGNEPAPLASGQADKRKPAPAPKEITAAVTHLKQLRERRKKARSAAARSELDRQIAGADGRLKALRAAKKAAAAPD